MNKTQFDRIIAKINDKGYYNKFVENTDTVSNIINDNDINSLKNKVRNDIDQILQMQKYHIINEPNILNETDMTSMDKSVKDNLLKLKAVIDSDTVQMSDVRDINKYVSVLQNIIDRSQNPSTCDIVSLYTKYSHLIHLMVSDYDENILSINDQNMFENKDDIKDLESNYIFTRCFASVSTLRFLLGGNNNNIKNDNISPTKLKELITSLQSVPAYQLDISVGAIYEKDFRGTKKSNFNHIFAIIKYRDDNGNDYYYLAQSYFYKYCPRTLKYSLEDILTLIDDIASIYYDKHGSPLYGEWTDRDNNIWKKYFFADETEHIGTSRRHNKNIKMNKNCSWNPDNCWCFSFTYNVININDCYKRIRLLIKYCEKDINNCFDNICRNFLMLFNINKYDRPLLIDAVKTNKFLEIKKGNNITINNSIIVYGALKIDNIFEKKYQTQEYIAQYGYVASSLMLLPFVNFTDQENYDEISQIPKQYLGRDGINEFTIAKSWKSFKDDLMKTSSKFIIDKFDINDYEECLIFLNILVQFYDLKNEVLSKQKYLGSNSQFLLNDQHESLTERFNENSKSNNSSNSQNSGNSNNSNAVWNNDYYWNGTSNDENNYTYAYGISNDENNYTYAYNDDYSDDQSGGKPKHKPKSIYRNKYIQNKANYTFLSTFMKY